jgi:small GTP-binding protein
MKVVLVGDTQVGKTCIIANLVNNTFKSSSPPTIGAAFQTHVLPTPQGPVTMQIWDTAGQEKYRALAPMYYRSADIAVLVYDVTQLDSFDAMEQWASELAEKAPPNLQLMVVGNKVDLMDDRVVQADTADAWAQLHNAKCYMEVSAKTGVGIDRLFAKAADLFTGARVGNAQVRAEKTMLGGQEAKPEKSDCC